MNVASKTVDRSVNINGKIKRVACVHNIVLKICSIQFDIATFVTGYCH
jgi:hypothetical protein